MTNLIQFSNIKLPRYTFHQYIDVLGMSLSGKSITGELANKYPEYEYLQEKYGINADIEFLNSYIKNRILSVQDITKAVLLCMLKNTRCAKEVYDILLNHLIRRGADLFILTPYLFEIQYTDYGNVIIDSNWFELISRIIMKYYKLLNIKYIKELTNWKNIVLDDISIDYFDNALYNRVNVELKFDSNNNINQELVFKYIKICLLLLPYEYKKVYEMNDFLQIFIK